MFTHWPESALKSVRICTRRNVLCKADRPAPPTPKNLRACPLDHPRKKASVSLNASGVSLSADLKTHASRVRPLPSLGVASGIRRSDMKLHELRDNDGATKRRKRVGRGIKGQRSRSGVAIKGFEGGQMPLYQRLPKRGFTKPNRKEYAVVNLGLIQKFIDAGKLDAKAAITEDALVASGLVRRKLDGVRVLSKGDVTGKITLEVTGASKSAVEAVEKLG